MSRFRIPLANGRSYNPPPTRIDARPQNDPATAAGMRNVHRDTRGNVIAGVTAEGRKIGSGGGAPATATPRLDAGVQTPRLDSNPRQPVMSPGQRLAGRQSLFRDMQAAGRGGITPEMERRAADLGVPGSRFREVAGRINPAPAAIAAVDQAPQAPARSAFRAPMLPPGSPAPKAAEPAAPSLVEGAKALRDIGTILAARKPLEVAGPPAGAAPVAKAGAPVNFTPPPPPRPVHSVGEPATPAPAPAASRFRAAPTPTLGSAIGSDINALGTAVAGDIRLKGDQVVAGSNAVGRGVQAVQSGVGKAAGALASLPAKVTTSLIPGQTGNVVRSWDIPGKVNSAVRGIGEAGAAAVNSPVRALGSARDKAWRAVSR